MNVFCWLGWNEHSSVGPSGERDLDAVAEPRARAARRSGGTPPRTRTRRGTRRRAASVEQRRARGAGTAAQVSRSSGVGLLPGGAHFTAAVTHASGERAARRRRATDVGWLASPARCIARNSQSPLRSPVNTRPVRLAPWAAGASPSTTIRRRRVAEARHRAAPVVSSRNAARLSRATCLAPLDEARAGAAADDLALQPRPVRACRSTDDDSRLAGDMARHEEADSPTVHHAAARPARPDGDDRHAAARPRARPAPRRRRASRQAERAAERIAELKRVDAVYTLAARAGARDGGADRRGHAGSSRRSTRACSSATSATGPAPS